jgi:N-acetylglucosaminyldiphosphoundecaprenol N-acetyl-beta-D-mannosaminyltransferase
VGLFSPPFRSLTDDEDVQIVEMLNSCDPHIIWVALGSPFQEMWMAEHVERVNGSVMIGVGAAFDFLSGNKPHAPRWMQRSGLEWLFRLGSEPRRLWPRYRQYPRFVLLVLAQLLGLKNYPMENHGERQS